MAKAKKVVKKVAASIAVMVGKLVEGAKTIKVKKGATIKECLEAAGFKLNGEDVKNLTVNGEPAKLTDKVTAGDIILAVPQVDGGH